jgi:tyrosine-protein kinase Etk/Wzc
MKSPPEHRRIEPASADDAHLSDYLSVLVDNWRLIASVAATVFVLGAIYAFLGQPIYRADALIQVEDNTPSTSDAISELTAMFDNKATIAAEIELLGSRLVVGASVAMLHLDVEAKPRHFPLIGEWFARRASLDTDALASPPFNLQKFAWGNELIAVSQFDVPLSLREQAFTLVAKAPLTYELRSPDDQVVLTGAVGQLAEGMLSGRPVRLLVTQLKARPSTEFKLTRFSTQTTVFNLQHDLKVAEVERQSNVIGVTLDGENPARIADVVNTIAQQYLKQNRDRKSAEAEQTLSFLALQLPEVRTQLELAETRYNAYLEEHGTLNVPEEGRLLLQRMVEIKTHMLELQQQRDELIQRFNDAHPSVSALNAQIATLQRSSDDMTQQLSLRPKTEQGSLGLLRDVQVDTQLYTNLLVRTEQLRVLKAGQIGNVRLVDSAVVSEKPVRPRKLLVIPLALLLGLLAGIAAAFVKKALYGGVEQPEAIESEFGLPVYAMIPRSTEQPRVMRQQRNGVPGVHVLALSEPDDLAIEALRSLRTALQFASLDAANNVVMVTGPSPNTGKSFISVNLAFVLASLKKRVLLIDGDMRRGELHGALGVPRVRGLADVLRGAELEACIRRDVLPNLDFLSAGVRAPDSAELLTSERFTAVMEYAKSRYDLVLIDTPPVLAVTDACLIGTHAGTTLLTLRHAQHPLSAIGEAIKRLNRAGVPIKGALFNDVPRTRVGYGAYHAESYEYKIKHD